MAFVEGRGPRIADYDALYRWSIEHPGDFWEALWEFAAVAGDRGDGPALEHGERMPGARWFPGAKLNFAENLLRGPDAEPAIVFRNERGDRRELGWQALRSEVARVAAGLARDGVGPGDVVAAFLPNLPETVIAMLAAASRGATVHLLLARLRHPGRARPLRPGEAESPVHGGRLFLRGQDDRFARADRGRAARACRRSSASSSCRTSAPRRSGEPLPGAVRFADYGERDAAAAVRAPALRPSRSTCSIRAARPACPSASCTAPAARCCST